MANIVLTQPAGTIESDQRLVDIILYLTSLASQPRDIDSMLDTMRRITARWKKSAPLSQTDRDALTQLIEQLKDYLINHDSLRDFTVETLEDRLAANFTPSTSPRRFTLDFKSTILLAATLSGLMFFGAFPLPAQTRSLLTVPLFLLVCILCNIWFYLSLTNFKPALRQAFVLLSVGNVLLGVFFTHFVVVPVMGWGNEPLFKYGGLLIIASAAVAAMYLGLRVYARLLGLRTRFASLAVLVPVAIVTVGVAAVVTLFVQAADPAYFYFAYASLLLLTMFAFFGSGLARVIYRSVAVAYSVSIRWLAVFMLGTFIGSIAYGAALLALKQLSGGALSAALGLFAVPPVLLLLYSGYSFKRKTSR